MKKVTMTAVVTIIAMAVQAQHANVMVDGNDIGKTLTSMGFDADNVVLHFEGEATPMVTDMESVRISINNKATGITQVENEELRIENVYDLQGRKVARPSKGVYIVNGRKMLIRPTDGNVSILKMDHVTRGTAVPNHSADRNGNINQVALTLTDGSIKYYNTTAVSSIVFSSNDIAVNTDEGSDVYTNKIYEMVFYKAGNINGQVIWTLTIKGTMGGDGSNASHRALDLVNDGATLNAYWKGTEKVKVYKAGVLLGTLDATPSEGEKPVTATLSGDITTSGLSLNDELMLLIPRDAWDYTGQTGILTGDNSIEDKYDYATATVSILSISGSTVTTTKASFNNEQSIYRFGFKDGDDYIVLKDFIISDANNKLVRSLNYTGDAWTPTYGSISVMCTGNAPDDNFYYVALRNDGTTADSYRFIITDSNNALYLATKAIPASVLDTKGKFISAKAISASMPSFAPAESTIDNSTNVY